MSMTVSTHGMVIGKFYSAFETRCFHPLHQIQSTDLCLTHIFFGKVERCVWPRQPTKLTQLHQFCQEESKLQQTAVINWCLPKLSASETSHMVLKAMVPIAKKMYINFKFWRKECRTYSSFYTVCANIWFQQHKDFLPPQCASYFLCQIQYEW